jgi:hypothetical protein
VYTVRSARIVENRDPCEFGKDFFQELQPLPT